MTKNGAPPLHSSISDATLISMPDATSFMTPHKNIARSMDLFTDYSELFIFSMGQNTPCGSIINFLHIHTHLDSVIL